MDCDSSFSKFLLYFFALHLCPGGLSGGFSGGDATSLGVLVEGSYDGSLTQHQYPTTTTTYTAAETLVEQRSNLVRFLFGSAPLPPCPDCCCLV